MTAATFTSEINTFISLLEEARTAFSAERVDMAVALISKAVKADRPVLVCGNGGSAADAQHIVGELVGKFLKDRPPINAICLSSNTSTMTAWANDHSYEDVFARQVQAHGRQGGVLLALSTSGNSGNVVKAAETARALGMPVVSMTGQGGGKLAALSDVLFDVPSRSTPMIQQVHICLYHFLCARVEAAASSIG